MLIFWVNTYSITRRKNSDRYSNLHLRENLKSDMIILSLYLIMLLIYTPYWYIFIRDVRVHIELLLENDIIIGC
jgi:hypothetical protein